MQTELLEFYVESLYKNDLFSQKIIAETLGIWNNFSETEKSFYESITKRDALVNGLFSSKTFDEKYTYGEIRKSGVEKILNSLNQITDICEKSFYDLGSGNGKLVIHLGLISNFKKIVGVELSPIRIAYSKYLMDKYLPENLKDKVNFVEDNLLNVDVSSTDIIFINDICLKSMTPEIYKKMNKKSFLISSQESLENDKPISEISVSVTWTEKNRNWYIYKK